MESGIVSLQRLYAFIRDQSDHEALDGRSQPWTKLAEEVVKEIDLFQGFYLWGYYDSRSFWWNVYLGKAGFGRTAHLRARILKELKAERCALWRTALTEEELLERGKLLYPSMWLKSYEQHWKRSFHKTRATHIAWVSDNALSNAEVANIEADLIETLNPRGNIMRPVPPVSLQDHTYTVIRHFRKVIHNERGTGYRLVVKPPVQALGLGAQQLAIR